MNKKHSFLDLQMLEEELVEKKKSMSQLAGELSILYSVPKANIASCIRFLVNRYFTRDMISKMGKQRQFHKNNKV